MSIYGIYGIAFLIVLAVLAVTGLTHRRILTPEMKARRTRRRLATLCVLGILILSLSALWAFGTVSTVGGFGDPRDISAVVRIRAAGRFHDLDRPLTVSFDFGTDNPDEPTFSTMFEEVTLRIVRIDGDREEVVLYEEVLPDFFDPAFACSFRSIGLFKYDYRFSRSIDLDIDLTDASDLGRISIALVFAPGESGSALSDLTVETWMRYEITGNSVRLFSIVEESMFR